MGEVNECEDKNLSRKVMLKRILKVKDFSRLLDEQKALIRLRSKHVVQLLDVVKFDWQGGEVTCLVLEHIEGGSLDQKKYQPGIEYQKILWQIASGLSEIHEAGIIHRDVKPENIKVDANGVVKIFDFGLAREVGKDDKTQSIIGTLGYMAPELFGTKTISFSPAVDVYAFGRTALSLLGIQPPNERPIAIAAGTVIARVPRLDSAIANTIESCLEINPANRPRMAEVACSLARDLLRDKHRARAIHVGKAYELNAANRSVNINSGVASARIVYDGTRFSFENVNGNIYINNKAAQAGSVMLSACVITIGSPGSSRAFVTFDVSNPEIMA
jgi:serine/threonine protein kinase